MGRTRCGEDGEVWGLGKRQGSCGRCLSVRLTPLLTQQHVSSHAQIFIHSVDLFHQLQMGLS